MSFRNLFKYSPPVGQQTYEQEEAQREALEKIKGSENVPNRAVEVVITGVKINFWDILVLMIRIGVASIPAAIIVYFFWKFIAGIIIGTH